MAKSRSKKETLMSALTKAAMGVVGGYAGNFTTSFLERQPFMAQFVQFTPLVTLALGTAGMIFLKNPMLKNIALGMTIVSGTEQAEALLSGVGATAATTPGATAGAMGNSNPRYVLGRGLGYVPQVMPAQYAQSVSVTPGGVTVR